MNIFSSMQTRISPLQFPIMIFANSLTQMSPCFCTNCNSNLSLEVQWKSIFNQCAHSGNSSVSFDHDGIHDAGFIEQMWRVVIKGQPVTLMVMSPQPTLSALDQLKNPYSQYPGLACQLVYSHCPTLEQWIVISPEQIIGHVAYYNRPPGTFGIQQAITVIVNK
jgi:hypothetical protein